MLAADRAHMHSASREVVGSGTDLPSPRRSASDRATVPFSPTPPRPRLSVRSAENLNAPDAGSAPDICEPALDSPQISAGQSVNQHWAVREPALDNLESETGWTVREPALHNL
eukprot:1408967-Rhodomonas_salina.2